MALRQNNSTKQDKSVDFSDAKKWQERKKSTKSHKFSWECGYGVISETREKLLNKEVTNTATMALQLFSQAIADHKLITPIFFSLVQSLICSFQPVSIITHPCTNFSDTQTNGKTNFQVIISNLHNFNALA